MDINSKSIWEYNTNNNNYKTLNSDINTDICIIGGGIAGINIAYKLYKNNLNFIVLEKNKICNKTTKYSTAKITAQHGLIYYNIKQKYGLSIARKYLNSNLKSIEEYKEIISNENIDCDFETCDSIIFTQDINRKKDIENEYKCLRSIGYTSVEILDNETILPNIKYSIKFKNQAKFNPVKYTYALSNLFNEKIYEYANVKNIKRRNNKYIIYANNNKIICNKVILCTHFPIKDIPGFYFVKMYQDTSYAIAVNIKDTDFKNVYLNLDNPTISIRTAKIDNNNILIVGGNNTKTGDTALEKKYEFLENIAKQIAPNCEILARWSTQDCMTLDQIPYIGKFSNFMPNFYITTGFNKWGFTTSIIASNIILNKILGNKTEIDDTFFSTRVHPIKNINKLYYNINQSVQSIFLNKFKIKKEILDKIPNDTGRIIKINNKKIGIYKDINGKIFKVHPYCSHLKCVLTFNAEDKTWDCPCHGSRFDIYGNILNSPANINIHIE